jgi:hypothetical protein
MQQKKGMRLLLTIMIALGWFAIMAQFYLIINNRVASIPETVIRFFSFFTILTNILVALCCTVLLLNNNSKVRIFFSNKNTLTAIAVYITIVGVVYNLILRFLWKPEGLQWIVDELLHSVIPILFLILWLLFIPKGRLQMKSVFAWLLYPLVYLIFILIRGLFSGFYPYPFIDVINLGYNKVVVNSTGMLSAFLVISVLFVLIDRFKKT